MGDDLSDDGVGASADVLGTADHPGSAVLMEFNTVASASVRAAICTGRHAPADDQAVAVHGADRGVALAPAEFLGAGGKTLLHVADEKDYGHMLSSFGLVKEAGLVGSIFSLRANSSMADSSA